jgi:meiotically up-regulated gene 157 (Mug157) protein
MKISRTSTIALVTLACSVFPDVALAMTRDQVPNFRNGMFLAAPPEEFARNDSTIYNATFEQLIDHENPSLGTFSQFYYYSTEFWNGTGSPVVSTTKVPMAIGSARSADLQIY